MKEPRDNEGLRAALTSEEAAEWFILTKDHRPLAIPRRRKYVRWLKQSPQNVAEALLVNDVYHLLQAVKLDPVPDEPRSSVITLDGRVSRAVRERSDNVLAWKIAASVSAVLLLTLVLLLLLRVAWTDPLLETEVGNWRTEELDDGSMVRMGPRTQLRIEFDERRRLVHLLSGEAVFRVTKDADRPFIVSNAYGSARALGTRFGVVRLEDRMVVTVAEGVVAVSGGDSRTAAALASTTAGAAVVTLSANQQVTVRDSGLEAVRNVQAERELAWAQRMLVFQSTTVAQVIEELNRRNRTQIEVADSIVRTYAVDGVFSATDPESFIAFLQKSLPVTIRHVEPEVLRIELAVDGGTQ